MMRIIGQRSIRERRLGISIPVKGKLGAATNACLKGILWSQMIQSGPQIILTVFI
jgi:hypothetical protein